MALLDKAAILAAIRDTPNLVKAAKRLGIARKTLYNRMKAYGIPKGRSGRPKVKIHYTRRSRRYAFGTVVVATMIGIGGAMLHRRRTLPA